MLSIHIILQAPAIAGKSRLMFAERKTQIPVGRYNFKPQVFTTSLIKHNIRLRERKEMPANNHLNMHLRDPNHEK